MCVVTQLLQVHQELSQGLQEQQDEEDQRCRSKMKKPHKISKFESDIKNGYVEGSTLNFTR